MVRVCGDGALFLRTERQCAAPDYSRSTWILCAVLENQGGGEDGTLLLITEGVRRDGIAYLRMEGHCPLLPTEKYNRSMVAGYVAINL